MHCFCHFSSSYSSCDSCRDHSRQNRLALSQQPKHVTPQQHPKLSHPPPHGSLYQQELQQQQYKQQYQQYTQGPPEQSLDPGIGNGGKNAFQNLPGVNHNVPCSSSTSKLDWGMDASSSSNSSIFGMGEGQGGWQMLGSGGVNNVGSNFATVNSTSPFGMSLWSSPAPSNPQSSGQQW